MEVEALYKSYKPLLFSIAYRMLGRVADAEDIVQDAFVTAQQLNHGGQGDTVLSWKAYLCRTVTNRCLDDLKSARRKRERYVGPWLPEPLAESYLQARGYDPFEETLMGETLSYAFLVMQEQLTPAERAVFIFREAFDYDYREIAQLLRKTEVSCRKMYSRIRKKIEGAAVPAGPGTTENKRLLEQFIRTAASGDMQALMHMLTEDIVLVSDGGGKVKAALRPIETREKVAAFLAGLAAKSGGSVQLGMAVLNGQTGLLLNDKGEWTAVCFERAGEQYRRIYLIRNPDKLVTVQSALPDGE